MNVTLEHPSDVVLFDFASGDLDPAHMQRVKDHLGRCVACYAMVDAAETGRTALANELDTAQLTDSATSQIDSAIDQAWSEQFPDRKRLSLKRSDPRAAVEATPQSVDQILAESHFVISGSVHQDTLGTASSTASYHAKRADRQIQRARGSNRPQKMRRSSRIVLTVLALSVLGAVAGTSVWLTLPSQAPDRETSVAAPAPQELEASTNSSEGVAETEADSSESASEARSGNGIQAETSTESADEAQSESAQPESAQPDDDIIVGIDAIPSGLDSGEATMQNGIRDSDDATATDETDATDPTSSAGQTEKANTDQSLCVGSMTLTTANLPKGAIPREIIRLPLFGYVICT